ncbi:hypothetical protein [Pseudophaeobacter sp. A-200-2]|uniref:hypothetical protein n=1 Tax=Pseudophaeobacter sp. A-200-2 TaxID=3098145 RepID=UPI0034D4426A
MRIWILSCLFSLLLAPPTLAGAWLRQTGQGFVAASATLRQTEDGTLRHELGYFGEYGWSPRLTLGVDLNQNDRQTGHALLFARIPLLRGHSRPRFALTVAAGGSHQHGHWSPMSRTTLSVGHEFTTARASGWISVDASYEYRAYAPDPIWKLDATIGLNTGKAFSPMLQIETSRSVGAPLTYAITPRLRYRTAPGQELVVGLEHKQANRQSLGLKISLWHRF